MPAQREKTLQEMLESINDRVLEDALGKAISTYLSDNMDLHEGLIDKIVDEIKNDEGMMAKLANAATNHFVRLIESGEMDFLDIDAVDNLQRTIGQTLADKVRSVIAL